MDYISIKEIQNKLLEMIVELDKYCNENDIKYYLMGGSALGAIRHKGFIPWDDDLDIFMDWNNYTKFIKKFEKEPLKNYYLQRENSIEWPSYFTKVRLNGTTFIEEDTIDHVMHKGFYIDIMCLNNASNYKFIRFIQYVAARVLVAGVLNERGYSTNSKFKKIVMKLSKIANYPTINSFLLKIVRFYNKHETKYVGHYFGRAKFKNTSFKKEWIGNPKYVDFETAKLPVFSEVEKYLKLRYGENYMKMPSESIKSQYPSHAIFADLSKDYSYYESINFNFLENKNIKEL